MFRLHFRIASARMTLLIILDHSDLYHQCQLVLGSSCRIYSILIECYFIHPSQCYFHSGFEYLSWVYFVFWAEIGKRRSLWSLLRKMRPHLYKLPSVNTLVNFQFILQMILFSSVIQKFCWIKLTINLSYLQDLVISMPQEQWNHHWYSD